MPKSNYLENKFIDHIFRAATFSKPSAIYVALFTATPSDTGGGTECSGGGYARVSVPPANANWNATSGSDGKTANTAAVTFGTPSGNWGSIVAFAIMDASSGGNFLYWGPLTNAKTVNNGDPAPKFETANTIPARSPLTFDSLLSWRVAPCLDTSLHLQRSRLLHLPPIFNRWTTQ